VTCADYQQALSAQADGEDPGVPAATLTAHVASCAACRAWVSGLSVLSRSARLRAAEPVPDLTDAILAALPAGTALQRWRSWEPSAVPAIIRLTLVLVAAAQVIAALPALWGDDMGATIHVAHEQGAWGIALAAGLLFAAWRPSRALAIAPMLAAFVAVLAVTTAVDVGAGRVAPSAEVPHLMTAFGLGLLWLEAHPPRPQRIADHVTA
jgi:predicted anti-sigma-YlaC factor YlaD